eukprot:1459151-Alexandrium_andersonii.AAC.1
MKRQWDPTFQGNGDIPAVAAAHCVRYADCMPEMGEFEVEEITTRKVMQACRAASPTAGGPDGWSPADFKVLPAPAARLLAMTYDEVERGKGWPVQMRLAKCAHVCKVGEVSCEPNDYRGLLIVAVAYRCWANIRLRD